MCFERAADEKWPLPACVHERYRRSLFPISNGGLRANLFSLLKMPNNQTEWDAAKIVCRQRKTRGTNGARLSNGHQPNWNTRDDTC